MGKSNIDLDALSAELFSSFGIDTEVTQPQEKQVACVKTKNKHITRRITSELALESTLPWHFEQDATYHCISFGDVDSLTYLRAIVKQQPLDYCLLSTWCMAIEDAREIKIWLAKGYIKRIDFYVGEIFKASYSNVYDYIKQNCLVPGARIAIFRNHSKVMVGYGSKFDFAIASSANVNTNPRCENTTITVSREVADFYKTFFDDIKAFNRDCDRWEPYQLDTQGKKKY